MSKKYSFTMSKILIVLFHPGREKEEKEKEKKERKRKKKEDFF